ncbi:MAG: 4Fe-4S cluster-binding domain-containing protein [Tenuifilaceae bacterium]|nr:4Fe-4S cluster-binding domain-containing protein [Tenuifilaceae bacterium]
MIIKQIVDENFQDYKKASMFIVTPTCDFKCLKEQNLDISICQNSSLTDMPDIDISANRIVNRYLSNPITSAIVIGGLEPFLQFNELLELVDEFRLVTGDDIVIYTGYNLEEIEDEVSILSRYENIIIKFGRYLINSEPIYDEVLGVTLASNNQYAVKIS